MICVTTSPTRRWSGCPVPPSGPKVRIAAGCTESMIAASRERSFPSTSNDARPPSGEPRAELAEHVERREAAVGEADDVELFHAEPVGGAGRLLGACGGECGAGGDPGEVGYALRAVGGDDEMRLATLSRETGEQRADDPLVVGMSEDGEDGAAGLGLRLPREREERGERRSCQ